MSILTTHDQRPSGLTGPISIAPDLIANQVLQRLVMDIDAFFPRGIRTAGPELIRPIDSTGVRHQRVTTELASLLESHAPPNPPCFPTREGWIRWLHAAEASSDLQVIKRDGRTGPGEAGRGRTKTKEINERIDFCRDCTHQHQSAMQREGRCTKAIRAKRSDVANLEMGARITSMSREINASEKAVIGVKEL